MTFSDKWKRFWRLFPYDRRTEWQTQLWEESWNENGIEIKDVNDIDARNKIITILDTADIQFDILEDRNLKVFPKSYAEEDFIHHLFSIVKPDKWYSPAVVEWLKYGTYDDEQIYYLMVEFD